MASYGQSITTGSTIYESAGFPAYPSGGYHAGIDTVHTDLLAYAPAGGTVIWVQVWDGVTKTGNQSWGNAIRVKMSDGRVWLAAHFASALTWSVGDTINKGDLIGTQGQSGNVTGTHTHWELWPSTIRNPQDPSVLLGIPNGVGTYEVYWDVDTPPGPSPSGAKLPIWLLFKMARGGKLW